VCRAASAIQVTGMIVGMLKPFTFLADAFDVSSARELGERPVNGSTS
jgi:hypothetical protein